MSEGSAAGRGSLRAARISIGNFLFRRRNAVFPLVMLALAALFAPWRPADSARLDLWMDAFGLMIALAGQAVRAAVIGFVYIKRGGLNKKVYAASLVTSGFFGLSRNPLYLGNFLIMLGMFVIHGNPFVIVLGSVLALLAYTSIVAAEEAYLSARFGAAYEAYCRDVPRWWPAFGRFAEATQGLEFDWRRVIVKDYSTACSWIATALLLLAYEAVRFEGLVAAAPRLAILGAVLVALLLATWATRIAKKSGRLAERASA